MKPEEMNALLEAIKAYQPLIKILTPMLEEAGVDLLPTVEKLIDKSVDLQLRFFNRLITRPGSVLEEEPMTRDEAIQVLTAVTAGIVKRGMSE